MSDRLTTEQMHQYIDDREATIIKMSATLVKQVDKFDDLLEELVEARETIRRLMEDEE